MPPVGDMMSDAQVADVVNYVRTHFGNATRTPFRPSRGGDGERDRTAAP